MTESNPSPTGADHQAPATSETLTTSQWRLLGVGMIAVAVIGGALWWLLVSYGHVNLVPLGVGVLILAVIGIVTAWTGLK